MTELVSIITPMYNSSKFVEDTILSVISQTYQNWELLITDDCSTDNSIEIVNRYIKNDSRIKLFRTDFNMGVAYARNLSISKANGKFIAFLDSDDFWAPTKLEKQLIFMKSNKYAFTMTGYTVVNEASNPLKTIIRVPDYIDYNGYLKNTIIGCLTVIINKEVIGEFQMPIIKSSQDMALWLKLMKRGYKVYGLNESLAFYRLVSNSNTSVKWKAAKDVWRVYRQFENLSFICSLYNFLNYIYNAFKKRI